MTAVAVAPIVEGHGEVAAIRILLTRVVEVFLEGCVLDVLQPIRISKSKIVSDKNELFRAIDLAALKLAESHAQRKFVLLLIDADNDAACKLGPALLADVFSVRSHLDFSCIIAVVEFETWLVGGAETLGDLLIPGYEQHVPEQPEAERVGKGWIQQFFLGAKYSESVDQVRLTARFDLRRARARIPSFDKLCREMETRCIG